MTPKNATPEIWPDVAGRLVHGGRHVLPIRIYFEDTDFSGVVYHGSYIRFMERGRSDFVRLVGLAHTALGSGEHGEQLVFAVRRIHVDFYKPARIDDLIEVETSVVNIGGARLVLRQAIRRGEELLVEAEVTVVLVSTTGKARRIPETVRRVLDPEETS